MAGAFRWGERVLAGGECVDDSFHRDAARALDQQDVARMMALTAMAAVALSAANERIAARNERIVTVARASRWGADAS